ncbi:hypothetical protein ES703_112144 [subsurface metagenome]
MANLYLPWPYAAKAIIQHEFAIDLLNLWVTFRHSMRQAQKPGNDLWICTVDAIEEPIFSSAWQDPWTLLLVIRGIEALPDRVLLAYHGPTPLLRTTWHKQWEPWGPILSLDVTT